MTAKNVFLAAAALIALAGTATIHAEQRQGPRVRTTPERRIPHTPFIVQDCRDRFGAKTCPPGPYVSLPVPTGRGRDSGGVRLLVEPATATVYVDGSYAGRVSDFSKPSQRLEMAPGAHRIEMRAPGYATLDIETRIYGGQTVPLRGSLLRETESRDLD